MRKIFYNAQYGVEVMLLDRRRILELFLVYPHGNVVVVELLAAQARDTEPREHRAAVIEPYQHKLVKAVRTGQSMPAKGGVSRDSADLRRSSARLHLRISKLGRLISLID